MLKAFIEQLSSHLALKEAPTLEEGEYRLTFDPGLLISLRENSDSGITLFTRLGSLPGEDTGGYVQKLMVANVLGRETGRAILGLDKEGKEVTFTLFLSRHLSYKEFHDRLEDFVNYAEAWRTKDTHAAEGE